MAVVAAPAPPDVVALPPHAASYRDLAGVDTALQTRNLLYLASTWAIIGAATTIVAKRPRWWTIAAASVVISGRQHALLNVYHECIHNMFVKGGKQRNDAVGRWLCAAPCGSPYAAAKQTHLTHHRLLADIDDPDRELHAGEDKATRRGLRGYFVNGLLGGYAKRSLVSRGAETGRRQAASRADVLSIGATHAALWGGSAMTLGWWVYPVLWAGPLGTLTSFLHLLRSFAEHAVTDDESAGHRNRLVTVTSNPVELSFAAPYNMNFHAEHHCYPFVPSPRLPLVRERMASDPAAPPVLRRGSYLGTLWRHYRSLP